MHERWPKARAMGQRARSCVVATILPMLSHCEGSAVWCGGDYIPCHGAQVIARGARIPGGWGVVVTMSHAMGIKSMRGEHGVVWW